MTEMKISDTLRYITIRILTSKEQNTIWSGAGTGFLFLTSKGEKQAPMLVTNKHVLEGSEVVGLTFHETKDGNNTPFPGPGRVFNFKKNDIPILYHPDPDVDLAAITLAGVVEHIQGVEKWSPFIKCLGAENLPDQKTINDLGAIEEIVMVGYPTGLADTANNFPIVRKGITSTPYKFSYLGKKQFLADIPVFGGSSGSPICILNEGSYLSGNSLIVGSRFYLLGILYAGHTQKVNGEIVSVPVPTSVKPVAQIEQIINLGLCIKSELINDLVGQIPGW